MGISVMIDCIVIAAAIALSVQRRPGPAVWFMALSLILTASISYRIGLGEPPCFSRWPAPTEAK